MQTKTKFYFLSALFVCWSVFFALSAHAQSALSLSVTPTLFDMSANPTQEWSSNIRIINPNPYDIVVYAEVVNFAPEGEAGQGKFVPIIEEESKGQTIAEWLEIDSEPIKIGAEQTIKVPFKINVPIDASPGGHFAAILIGTKPTEANENAQLVTSQIVTSLVFLRVTGDIKEQGNIRSFRAVKRILEEPQATFELRFENKGNVHLQPQGEIEIKNMWGQTRGVVPVNQSTMFGNVLPESIRNYSFTWTGEWSIADMGRYTAVAALAYGENGRKFATSETSFWVIPWKMLGGILLIIVGFIMVFTWAIKLYIRRMLMIAGVTPGYDRPNRSAKIRRRVSIVSPIEAGMLDLREQWEGTSSWSERFRTIGDFVSKYKIFFIVLVLLVAFLSGLFWFVNSASVEERSYDVKIEGMTEDVRLSSEELQYQELKSELPNDAIDNEDTDLPPLNIVNRSGVNGLAAELRIKLEKEGYKVLSMTTDRGVEDNNTVIVYDPDYSRDALELSRKIYDALLSAYDGSSETGAPITIYVGQDLENAVQ